MELPDIEKIALEKIAALSTKDRTTVREVLYAILTYITLTMYEEDIENENKEIIIPYIGKLKLKYKEDSVEEGYASSVIVEADAAPTLIQEFVCLKNGEDPPSKKFYRRQIKNTINRKLFPQED